MKSVRQNVIDDVREISTQKCNKSISDSVEKEFRVVGQSIALAVYTPILRFLLIELSPAWRADFPLIDIIDRAFPGPDETIN